jgi:hypothetical protein
MLPKSLKYQSKVESSMAKSYRTNVAPQNGTSGYNLGDTIIVNIPTRQNLCLASTESYLKFNLVINNTSGAANSYRLDSSGAHGLIQRIRVWSGSNLLEDSDNYALLAKMLYDLQMPDDTSKGKASVLCGTRSDLAVVSNTAAAYAQNAVLQIFNTNSGEIVGSAIANNASTTARTYCLSLISIVGALNNSNYFPLWAASSAPLRVEIQLVDSVSKFSACTSNVSTISISNVEYVANFIELNDNAMAMIQESLQGQPLQFCVPQYRNYQYTYNIANGSTTQVNIPVPAKYSSLKSLFLLPRDKPNNAGYFPHSTVKFGISNYYWRLGSQIVPTKAPDNLPEMFAETLKAIGSIADINHQPAIDYPTYTLDTSLNNSDTSYVNSSGSFYIGLDVEQYSASDRSTIFAGYNSNTDDIFAVVNYAGTAGAATLRFDAFALFDEVLVFENNTCYAKF